MCKSSTAMSHRTSSNCSTTPEKANALDLSTSEEDKELNLSSVLVDNVADNIKSLTDEFKSLYEQRLEFLDVETPGFKGEDLQQKKVDVLQCYVNDLTEQNQVLIQTIEDLQNEHLSTTKVSEEAFKALSLDELVGPTAHSAHCWCSLVDITTKLEDLKVQLQTKDTVISDLEKKLRHNEEQSETEAALLLEKSQSLAHLQTQLSCLQQIQKGNIKEITEKDICITKLRANIEMLQQEETDKSAQLTMLNERVKELQEEVRRKAEGWRKHQDEAEERSRHQQQERDKEAKEREEEWKRAFQEERKAHDQMVEKAAFLSSELEVCRKQVERQSREVSEFQQKEETLLMQMKAQEEHVRHLDQDVVCLQTTQDSLKRTLAVKEKHAQQLAHDNAQLKDNLTALQSQLHTSECMVSDTCKSLDETGRSLETERRERQRIQDHLLTTNKEVERLQRELIHLRLSTEKKIQRREIKKCALLKDLTDSKRLQSDCQTQLLNKDASLNQLCEERDELRAKMAEQHREYIHLKHTKERLEADLALSHEKLHTSHLEVKSREQLILQLRGEMKTAEQKHRMAMEQMEALEGEVRRLNKKVKGHQEEACQLSEKVRSIERLKDQKEQEQERLQDQLCTSHQQLETSEEKLKTQRSEIELLHQQLKEAKEQLREASLQAHHQNEPIAIFKQKYTAAIEKVHRVQGQVEVSEEELRYSKQQLRESQAANQAVKDELVEMEQRYQEKVGQWENSQEALDQLTDELQSCQSLLRDSQQKTEDQKGLILSLQDQVGALQQQNLVTEGDLKLYQQSHSCSNDEYLSQQKQREQLQKRCAEQVEHLAECEKAILQMKSELERQAQEKMDLQKQLVVLQRTHLNSCTQHEQEAACLKKEVTRLELELADSQKVHVTLLRSEGELREARHEAEKKTQEVLTLQEELQKEEQRKSDALREKHRLNAYIRQLREELEELCSKHQVTVEELAARAEEARRMEGCLNKKKLAEEKIRSVVLRLETERSELKRDLREAVDQKLKAETEKQEAQEQVDLSRLELDVVKSENSNLRRESQLVMTNVDQWITQQKTANESIAAQMKAQSKVLSMVTEENEHLQEANNSLKAELQRLKEELDERERDEERFKAQFEDGRCCWRDDRTAEQETCIALNLCKIEDMQTRLRNNLGAVQKLNQQLNILSRENRHLHRQLEEERSLRRQVERLCVSSSSASHKSSSVHPLPVSTSLRSSPPETRKADRFPAGFKESMDRPFGSQFFG